MPGVTLSARLLIAGKEYIKPGIEVTALKRGAEPIDLAKAIAFLQSDEAIDITGTVLRYDGGAFALQH
jgi:NAD(P)-dependent dehydrogenase (short-subunit alcohol dehydrogenase family)